MPLCNSLLGPLRWEPLQDVRRIYAAIKAA
jgi:hypothetical protein